MSNSISSDLTDVTLVSEDTDDHDHPDDKPPILADVICEQPLTPYGSLYMYTECWMIYCLLFFTPRTKTVLFMVQESG